MEGLTGMDPRAVGEFRLRARLGAGGMGQVYLATSPGGRMVAVKVIRPELTGDSEFVRRFRAEVDAARRVSGMYTAPVVAAGTDDMPPWLATAFVPGPSLESAVVKYGPLSLPALWRLASGLADALRAIHATGLVHRDLKPANVLLAADGPRVIDFGIARAVTESRLTATGSIIGTPQFMSPEQVQGHPAGPPSDVFSLGSVLAFAASGASPFSVGPEAMPAAVLYRVVHGAPQLDRVPPEARDLIQACLAKDPSWRPDLGQVAARCAAAAESLGMTPASFWPAEVAAAIGAQQAATTAEIAALASLEPAVLAGPLASPAPAPETWPGAGRPQPVTHGSPRPAVDGITRRRALIGAGIGGAAALTGAGAWLVGSWSTGNTSGRAGVDVPMSGTAVATARGTGAGVTAVWTFPTDNLVLANPGAANGTVYVGDEDKFLYAVDAATGKQRWKAGIGWVTAPPQVVNGMVCAATSEGVFSAIHASTGTVAWQLQTDTAAAFRPNWAVNGKTVLLPSVTDPLTVYDAVTGAKGPVTFGSPGQFSSGAIGVANGILYAIETSGDLFAVEIATADKKWDVALSPADGANLADLVVSGSALYITDDAGVLYSLSTANGKQNWSYPAGGSLLSHPVVGDGLVYVTDDSGTLHAVATAHGTQAWTGKAMSGGEIGPALSGGTLYVSADLALQALNAQTGDAIWSFTAPVLGAFTSTPAISGGLVFVGSTNKNLYAIRA